MITLLAHRPLVMQHSLMEGKNRRRILAAAGLEQRQLLQILLRNLARAAHHAVHRLMRQIILWLQLRRNVSAEALAELRHLCRRQRQACRLMMSAKLRKNIPLRGNRFIKVQRRNAAAAALRHAVLAQTDKNRRQMILLHEARGHNADNSLMPAGRRQHNRRIYMLLLRQKLLCLLHNLAADFLTQAVFLIQLLCNRLSLRCILRNQQLHSQLCVLQTTYSIQPRRQAKADIIRRNILLRTAAGLNQGTQTDELRRLHRL